MTKQMPAEINVWDGPGSGWNDKTILNEVQTTKYVRADLGREPTGEPMWDDPCNLEDGYQEVARALGCTSFFHKDVMARARELARFARCA